MEQDQSFPWCSLPRRGRGVERAFLSQLQQTQGQKWKHTASLQGPSLHLVSLLGAGGGGNLAALPLWKGSSCLRRNSSHSFAVKKVLTCSGAFAEQVKTSQRQLVSAGRKWPVVCCLITRVRRQVRILGQSRAWWHLLCVPQATPAGCPDVRCLHTLPGRCCEYGREADRAVGIGG